MSQDQAQEATNTTIIASLPYVIVSAGTIVENHSMTGFRELPTMFETLIDPKTGKKIDVFFWISRGPQDISDYSKEHVVKAIYGAVSKYMVDHTVLRPTAEESLRITNAIIDSIPEINAHASGTRGAFRSAHHQDKGALLASLFIDALDNEIYTEIYRGGAIPDDAPGVCLCGECTPKHRVDFAYMNGKYTAILVFENKNYADWIEPGAMITILRHSISDLTNSIADNFK